MTIQEAINTQFQRPLTSKRQVKLIHQLKNLIQVILLRKELYEIKNPAATRIAGSH